MTDANEVKVFGGDCTGTWTATLAPGERERIYREVFEERLAGLESVKYTETAFTKMGPSFILTSDLRAALLPTEGGTDG